MKYQITSRDRIDETREVVTFVQGTSHGFGAMLNGELRVKGYTADRFVAQEAARLVRGIRFDGR